jgi:hypothetical protein
MGTQPPLQSYVKLVEERYRGVEAGQTLSRKEMTLECGVGCLHGVSRPGYGVLGSRTG